MGSEVVAGAGNDRARDAEPCFLRWHSTRRGRAPAPVLGSVNDDMGSRGKYETIAAVVQAFAQGTTWRQAELARSIGVSSRQLSVILRELQRNGMPLEDENEPPHVLWTVPNGWFPGAVSFEERHLPLLIDALLRIPDDKSKRTLLQRLLAGRQRDPGAVARLLSSVRATPLPNEEHSIILTAEQAILGGQALRLRYFSTKAGELEDRTITPLRVFLEPRPRIAALCHRDQRLKWFRVDNVERAEAVPLETAHVLDPAALESFLRASVDGYNDGSEEEHVFLVRFPESRWVRRNLPAGMAADPDYPSGKGLKVRAHGALPVVARFVVGLGVAARAESAELRKHVQELARGSLQANGEAQADHTISARQTSEILPRSSVRDQAS